MPAAWRWAQAAALVALALCIYWPALHGEWLWDDRADVVSNPLLRDASGLWRIWFHPTALPDYYPIKATVQWVQWQLWREHTPGYHLTNIALHVAGALLLWRLFARLGLRHAWWGALLFTVHPVMVESVAWIAELKNTLSLPPLLGACLKFIDYDEHRRPKDYLAALLLFLAALLCKTSVVMLPFVLLLHAWWRRRQLGWTDFRATTPFFALSLGLGLLTVWLQRHRAIGDEVIALPDAVGRIALAGKMVAFYFAKSAWPAGLMPLYPHWSIVDIPAAAFLPWAALSVVMVWGCLRRATAGAAVVLGLGWFVLHLLPFLGFVPISYFRFTWVMDHFLYVPIIGLIGLAVGALDAGCARLGPAWGRPVATVVALGALALAWLSHGYAGLYRTPIALWEFAARQNPGAWPAHSNLGLALASAGRNEEAITHHEAALKLKPSSVEAHNNLGNALLATGRPTEALPHFRAAIGLKPTQAAAHNNLGVALRRTGQVEAALPFFRRALQLDPADAGAWNNLGNALLALDRAAEAVPNYEAALRLQPNYAEAHYNFGVALAALGRLEEARQQVAAARRINPTLPDARF